MRYLPVLLLAGCVSTSQIVPHGNDAFLVNVDDPSGAHSKSSLQRKAIEEAQTYCAARGKIMRVQGTVATGNAWVGTSADVVFTCADK